MQQYTPYIMALGLGGVLAATVYAVANHNPVGGPASDPQPGELLSVDQSVKSSALTNDAATSESAVAEATKGLPTSLGTGNMPGLIAVISLDQETHVKDRYKQGSSITTGVPPIFTPLRPTSTVTTMNGESVEEIAGWKKGVSEYGVMPTFNQKGVGKGGKYF
jgi:hypothetical protein